MSFTLSLCGSLSSELSSTWAQRPGHKTDLIVEQERDFGGSVAPRRVAILRYGLTQGPYLEVPES